MFRIRPLGPDQELTRTSTSRVRETREGTWRVKAHSASIEEVSDGSMVFLRNADLQTNGRNYRFDQNHGWCRHG
jgi:hypothetical protein